MISGTFFGELYLRSTRPLLSEEVSQSEAVYLARNLASSGPLLDIGCGHGRHAARLRRMGRTVLGLELDPLSLQQRLSGFPAVRADMRALPFRAGSLAGAFAWYSTLFVFQDSEHPLLLAEIARALRPGGRLILQSVPYERVEAAPDTEFAWTFDDGSRLEEHSHFDAALGRDLGARRLSLPDGRVLSGTYAVRYYREAELASMLEEAGFTVCWVHGDVSGQSLEAQSTDLIIGAERRDG